MKSISSKLLIPIILLTISLALIFINSESKGIEVIFDNIALAIIWIFLAALFIFSRVEHRPYLWIVDRLAIVVALSCFFIRMGNLMNSEIFGFPTSLPWGFAFVRSPEWYQPPVLAHPCHPTQIYEGLAYLAIFVCLCRMYFSKNNEKPHPAGVLFGTFLVSMFTMRFLIEFLKENQVDFEKGMMLNMGQLLSIPFILCGVYLLVRRYGFPFFTCQRR